MALGPDRLDSRHIGPRVIRQCHGADRALPVAMHHLRDLIAAVGVEDARGGIHASRGEAMAVGVPCHAPDAAGVPVERADDAPVPAVEDFTHSILRDESHVQAIGTPCEGTHLPGRFGFVGRLEGHRPLGLPEHRGSRGSGQIPNLDRAILAADGKFASIGMPCHGPRSRGDFQHSPLRREIPDNGLLKTCGCHELRVLVPCDVIDMILLQLCEMPARAVQDFEHMPVA